MRRRDSTAASRLAEDSLKAEIVNCKDGLGRGYFGVACRLHFEKDDRQRSLPIVAMNDLHGPWRRSSNAAWLKKTKPFGIVRIVSRRWARREIPDRSSDRLGSDKPRYLCQAKFTSAVVSWRRSELGTESLKAVSRNGKIALQHRAISRRDHADFVAEAFHTDGESAEDVGQAAGLGEGLTSEAIMAIFIGCRSREVQFFERRVKRSA